MSVQVPGLVFPTEEVIPDVVWVSHGRLAGGLDNAGHLRVAPELVVEVTSPGSANIRRDRDVKLDFYDRCGVEEYWIVDPRAQTLDQYQRLGTALVHVRTARVQDTLTTPLLPGFAVRVETLFFA
jgi:Uma2 family endonuclease